MQTSLPTRALGQTGLEITPVGFGAWAIGGNMWGPQDDADSVAAIRHAVERGINWIDTAAVYGNGHSEEVIARALGDLGPDERPLVFTKGGIIRDAEGKNPRRLAANLREQCEDSLRRLEVEQIDLYQLHWPSDDIPLAESWGEMLRLKEEGLVAHVGLSNHWVDQLDEAEAMGHVETLQPPFSAIRRGAAATVLPWCERHGTGAICYSPMQAGLLTGSFTRERAASLDENDHRRTNPEFQGEALTGEPRAGRCAEAGGRQARRRPRRGGARLVPGLAGADRDHRRRPLAGPGRRLDRGRLAGSGCRRHGADRGGDREDRGRRGAAAAVTRPRRAHRRGAVSASGTAGWRGSRWCRRPSGRGSAP